MKKWPIGTTANQKRHAQDHVKLLEMSLQRCVHFRTAVQAGGNVGYWPMRMAEKFNRVITFEPEPITYECLVENLDAFSNIEIRQQALGDKFKRCSIRKLSLGSHYIVTGDDVEMIPLDSFNLMDLDLLQLDIEGYEFFALQGAAKTIERCKPIIHLEIRGFSNNFGINDSELIKFLNDRGYEKIDQRLHDQVYKVC
jgi:FkbM family methyltransferase